MENIFHETYKRLTPDTKAHADVFNTIFDQLFKNDSLLKENQEIEYITEGSILELCDKKKKSFRFLAYNDIGRGSSCSLIDTPSTHTDGTGNIWIGEFQWLIPIYEKGKTRPTNFHCILKMRNLLGEDYAKTGWLMGKEGEEIIGWDNWIQANGCSFAVNADVHGLGNGKYYVVRGINLPNGLTDSYVEVFKNDYIEELLCRDGANIYIKKRFPYTEWGEWRCLSSDKTMPVYVGSTAPEDTNVLWVW